MDSKELKDRVPLGRLLEHYGSLPNEKGIFRCLFPKNHTNGDVHASGSIANDRAYCHSQRCLDGHDIFAVVGKMENLPHFTDQRAWLLATFGLTNDHHPTPEILRVFQWTDAQGRVAFHLRMNGERKFMWNQQVDGCGAWTLKPCQPDLWQRELVLLAQTIVLCAGERDAGTLNRWLQDLEVYPSTFATTPYSGEGSLKPAMLEVLHGKEHVYILGDNDPAGIAYRKNACGILRGHVPNIYLLYVPKAFNDTTEWAMGGGTAQDFQRLLVDAPSIKEDHETIPFRASPTESGVYERGFSPPNAPQFVEQVQDMDVDWIFEGYLARGSLILWVAKPKTGKSTIIYQLARAVAKGRIFLGRDAQQGGVLILAPEEHPRDIKLRLLDLEVEHADNLFIYCGSVTPDSTFFHDLKAFIKANNITLCIIDTLSSFWALHDENDAGAMTQAVKPLLHLARESAAAVILIHHSRKSEGALGDEIRGSSALFALVDVAVMMRGHEVENQRKLVARSRYPETPSELIVEFRDGEYVSLGDPDEVNRKAKLEKMRAALPETPESASTIITRAGLKNRAGQRHLKWLADQGEAERMGSGKKGDPFLYSMPIAIHAGGTGPA